MPDRDIRSAASGTVINPTSRLRTCGAVTVRGFHPTEHTGLGLQFKMAVGLVLKFEVRQTRRQFLRTVE
jgi:hypothetical protein